VSGNDNYTIHLTHDPFAFREGALMMSEADPWITLGFTYDSCLQSFEGQCKEIYIIEQGREMAGFVILQVCGTFNGYIQTICIKEQFRGKGFGKKLLHFCEERIHKTSPNIFICVSEFNEGAIKLYYELGFTLIGTLRNFVKDGFDELLLRKTTGPRQGYKAG
jgi:ribosomal protein S18 acetylase RimI-like enzyme